MAEKGFGVKEVNLIGASGTPTITSPNNLNLNANNVAISTNVSIGGTLSVTGNVSVGGTLTYEDVTNIDSVGIITARQGVRVNFDSGNSAPASATNYFSVGASQDLKIYHNGGTNYIAAADGDIQIKADTFQLVSDDTAGRAIYLDNSNSRLELGFDGTAAAYVSSSNVQFAKPITASTDSQHDIGTNSVRFRNAYVDTYYGSGANLTGITITPTNSDIQVAYTVTANGSSAYRFAGNGVVSTADNPDLYLIRGKKYRFINNSGGSHPFQIRESSGGTAYSTGVTNNGAASGNIDFAPTFDSPAQLVYQCTSHGGMVGNIYLRGGNGNETNVGVTTFSGDLILGTNNKGISFANSSSSSDADSTSSTRVITDYDEGTTVWELHRSDGLTTGSNTADTKVTYTKIGNRVYISGYVYTQSTGGTTGVTARLTDASGNAASLPYTPNHHGILPICHTRTIAEYERMSVSFTSGSKTVYVHTDEGYNAYQPNTNNVNISSPQTHLVIAFTGSYSTDE